jgi:nitrite reductase/ring-hydroxylating ferredoxin subunit
VVLSASNPARPPKGTALCPLTDIPEPGSRGFDFRVGPAIFAGFVVRKAGRVVGYVDECPHAGWPLAVLPDRYLTREADRIFCGGHGALFRIEDGLCTSGPCEGDRLEPWPVAVDADGVIRTA